MRLFVFRLAWERLRNRAGLSDLGFHDLRNGSISRLFEVEPNITEVAVILCHKDLRMLLRYAHLRACDLVDKIRLTYSLNILTDRELSDARAKIHQFYYG